MSVLTTTQPVFGDSYFHNVAKAARDLLAALVAVRLRRAAAAEPDDMLFHRYEAVMPNLAQELRCMASRG